MHYGTGFLLGFVVVWACLTCFVLGMVAEKLLNCNPIF